MSITLPGSYVLLSYSTIGVIAYLLGWCIYCLWFHPLAKYPGPRAAAVSQVSRSYENDLDIQPPNSYLC